jgi:hypothetical protein
MSFPLADVLFTMLRPWKLGASMFIAFATLALLISAVGLAGTIAYAVGEGAASWGCERPSARSLRISCESCSGGASW